MTKAFRLVAPKEKKRSPIATHQQLVKIAHDVLQAYGSITDMADFVDLVKTGAARWKLEAAEPREITKAIESAIFQRRRCRHAK